MADTTDLRRRARRHDEDISDGLRALLATLPDRFDAAVQSVATAIGPATPVAIHRRTGLDWSLLTGPDLCDPSQLAALECDAGPLVERAGTVGDIAIVLQSASTALHPQLLRQGCAWLSLIAKAASNSDELAEMDAEAEVMRAVAQQILSARDLDQVLLSIINQTLRMSESDICGVFLREGDELAMRSCTGHRVVETTKLRMRRGQGVAGLVFETGDVAKVDSYLQDSTISKDFMSLAEQEATRSALAVPLHLHGELIGVLEVWRRRYSNFTTRDVRRLVALAALATIAIDNGRLYDSQRASLEQLQTARRSLEHQLSVVKRSANLQQSLIDIVLDNAAVPGAVAKTVGTELQCGVAVFSSDGDIEALHPRSLEAGTIFQSIINKSGTLPPRATLITAGDGTRIWAHPVIAGANLYGAVCLLDGDASPEFMAIACGQAAMACSLDQLQQRAASAARAEALDQILWELMEGAPEHRAAARSRMNQMGFRLKGKYRVLYGALENMDAVAAHEGWSTTSSEHLRREVIGAIRACSTPVPLTLASARGNWLVALAPVEDRESARALLSKLQTIGPAQHPDLKVLWGASTACSDPADYPSAFNEAKTALAAARRLGTVSLYDELGIVRLLLGSGQDPDLQGFIAEVTAPLVEYDEQFDGSLLKTLRTFFDANCSQKDAAERLFVHPKTLSYRLDRIRKLTGLDMSQHADRMRADLALRLLETASPPTSD